MADIAMDPRLVAALARVHLRAAVVGHVARAEPAGLSETDMRDGLLRVILLAKAPHAEVEWVMRSLERDGLIVHLAGQVHLGPKSLEILDRWSAGKIATQAPQAPEAKA
jgi:hypothetical protein